MDLSRKQVVFCKILFFLIIIPVVLYPISKNKIIIPKFKDMIIIDGPWVSLPEGAGFGLILNKERNSLTLKTDLNRMTYVLEPHPAKGPFANTVYRLGVNDGRLYLSYGDHYNNRGPVDIVSLDPLRGLLTREMSNIPEERVGSYNKTADSIFQVTGMDAMESWTFGNFYINDGSGWEKRRTIPRGVHVNGVFSSDGRLYAQLFGNRSVVKYPFALVSEDRGHTWSFERIDQDQTEYYYEEAKYASAAYLDGQALYASVFMIASGSDKQVRRLYRFDGETWDRVRINYSSGELIPLGITSFRDRLLVKGLEYDPSGKKYENAVYSLDEGHWVRLDLFSNKNFSLDHCTVYEGWFYCMVSDPENSSISPPVLYRTEDLENWENLGNINLLPGAVPQSIVFLNNRLYVGAMNGPGWWEKKDHIESFTVRVPLIKNGVLRWDADVPGGAKLSMKIRTAANGAELNKQPWIGPGGKQNTFFTVSGTPLPLQSNGDSYIQVSVYKVPNGADELPFVRWITIDTTGSASDTKVTMAVDQGQGLYTAENIIESGNAIYTSPVFKLKESNGIGNSRIFFDGAVPGKSSLKFLIRSANSKYSIKNLPFVGPDGSQTSFYQSSGQSLWGEHNHHYYIQYRAILSSSDLARAPDLRKVVLVTRPRMIPGFSVNWTGTDNWKAGEKRPITVNAYLPRYSFNQLNGRVSLTARNRDGSFVRIKPDEITLISGTGTADVFLQEACPTNICVSIADIESFSREINVLPGDARYISLTTDLTAPQANWSPVSSSGKPFSLILTVRDRYRNIVTGYTGTVKSERRSTGSEGQLFSPYTFLPSDKGVHRFNSIIINTKGEWNLVCYDSSDRTIAGSVTVNIKN